MSCPTWIKRLLSPLSYLRIQHDLKFKYDWLIPGALTIVTMASLGSIGYQIPILGPDGIISSFANLSHVLVGFFIAALTAVATFPKRSLDQLMSSPAPTLKGLYKGKAINRQLTRRRFLCFLFGYLAWLSLFL